MLGGEAVILVLIHPYLAEKPGNSEKIGYVIRQNFNGEQVIIPEHLTPFVSQVYLHDVLDFSRKEFNKAFNLSAQSKVEIVSLYEQFRLSDLCKEIYAGGDKPKKI